MMSVDYNPVKQALAIAREVKPEVVTIVGGPHVTLALEDSLRIPNVDYLVTHEGEVTFPRLLRAIAEGRRPAEKVIHGETPDLDRDPLRRPRPVPGRVAQVGLYPEQPRSALCRGTARSVRHHHRRAGLRLQLLVLQAGRGPHLRQAGAPAQRGQRHPGTARAARPLPLRQLHVPRRLPDRRPPLGDGVLRAATRRRASRSPSSARPGPIIITRHEDMVRMMARGRPGAATSSASKAATSAS